MTRLLVVLLVSLLLLQACQPRRDAAGGDGGDGGDDTATASGDARDLLLAVTVTSAWPNLQVPDAPAQPHVRVAGDGSFRAAVDDAASARSTWLTGTLSPAVLDDLLGQADALPGPDAYGRPGLDGSTTSLVLGTGSSPGSSPGSSGSRRIEVWVPGDERDGAEGRARQAFVSFLTDLDAAVREAGVTWRPEHYLLLTSQRQADDDRPRPAWPLAGVDPLPCQTVDAGVAARLHAVLDDRRGPIGLEHDGTVVGAVLLPVLTDETCAELEPGAYPLEQPDLGVRPSRRRG